MALIPTTLPQNVEAYIEIPIDTLTRLFQTIIDDAVIMFDEMYVINPDTGIHPTEHGNITIINFEYITDIILRDMTLELIKYQQITVDNKINKPLLLFLIAQLYRHPYFMMAMRNLIDNTTQFVPAAINVEDDVEFDSSDGHVAGWYSDQESRDVTLDILQKLQRNIQN